MPSYFDRLDDAADRDTGALIELAYRGGRRPVIYREHHLFAGDEKAANLAHPRSLDTHLFDHPAAPVQSLEERLARDPGPVPLDQVGGHAGPPFQVRLLPPLKAGIPWISDVPVVSGALMDYGMGVLTGPGMRYTRFGGWQGGPTADWARRRNHRNLCLSFCYVRGADGADHHWRYGDRQDYGVAARGPGRFTVVQGAVLPTYLRGETACLLGG